MISLISHVVCNAVQIFQIITQEEFKQSLVFSHSPLNSYLKLKKMRKQTTDWSAQVTPPIPPIRMRFQAHAARVHAFKPWWKCEKRVCAMVHRTGKFNPRACAGSLRHSPLISLALTAQESGKLRVSTLAWKEVEPDTHVQTLQRSMGRQATTQCTNATEYVYRCETERGPAVTPAGTACAAQMWKLIFVEKPLRCSAPRAARAGAYMQPFVELNDNK